MKTKEVVMILVLALIIGGTAYADVSLGIDGSVGSGIGTVRAGDFEEAYGGDDRSLNLPAGFDISAQFTFGDEQNRLFIRPEAGILFNNGLGNGFYFTYEDHSVGVEDDSDCKVSVSTIEIPILLGMAVEFHTWSIDYYFGPYISIPVSGSVTTAAGTSKLHFSVPVFGGTAGITGNLKAGPGAATFDMRYLFDFASTKMEIADTGNSVSIYARRNIILSAGYKISF